MGDRSRGRGIGSTIAAGAALLLGLGASPAAAEAAAKDACRQATTTDAYDTDGVLDISFASLDVDCATGRWAAYVETFDDWDFAQMAHLAARLDTDGDAGNGCGGFDYLVRHDPTVGGGNVTRTPSCTETTWTVVSRDVGLDASALDNAWITWDPASTGSPAGPVRARIVLRSQYGSVDQAPDGDPLVLEGGGAPTPPPDQGGGFSNGRCTIPFGETATNSSVARLYRAYFLRDADQAGLSYWVPKYRSGELCLTDISDYFAQSQEFVSRYGSLANPAFVRLVYLNVLDREPDPDGYTYWAHQITYGGVSRGTMMVGFSESAEFRSFTGLP